MDLCLRFAVRTYLIGGYRADAAQTRLYRLAYEVFNGTRPLEKLHDGLRQLVAEYASDDYVRGRLLDVEANWYRWGGLKYFLYEYELALLKGATPNVDFAFFAKSKREKSIEHLLPQPATSEYWTQQFPLPDRDRLTHALGNLVLTRDNSSYSNHDFPIKRGAAGPGELQRPCYAQSPLRQEQELAPLKDWNPEEVAARQHRLALWALDRWAVGPPTGEIERDILDADDEDDVLQDDASGLPDVIPAPSS